MNEADPKKGNGPVAVSETNLGSKAKGWSLAAYAMLTAGLSLIGTTMSIALQASDYLEKQPRIEFIENAVVVDNEPLEVFFSHSKERANVSFTLSPVRHRLRIYNPSSKPVAMTGVWISGSMFGGYSAPHKIEVDGEVVSGRRPNLMLAPRTAQDLDLYYAMTFETDNNECLKPRMRYPEILDCQNSDGTPSTRFSVPASELRDEISGTGADYAEIFARIGTADGRFFEVPLDYSEFYTDDANSSR